MLINFTGPMRRYLLPLSALVVFAGMATSVSAQVPRARIAPEAWFRTVPTSSSLLGTLSLDRPFGRFCNNSFSKQKQSHIGKYQCPSFPRYAQYQFSSCTQVFRLYLPKGAGTILQFPCPRNCHRNLCSHSNHLLLWCGTFWLKGTKWRRNPGWKG